MAHELALLDEDYSRNRIRLNKVILDNNYNWRLKIYSTLTHSHGKNGTRFRWYLTLRTVRWNLNFIVFRRWEWVNLRSIPLMKWVKTLTNPTLKLSEFRYLNDGWVVTAEPVVVPPFWCSVGICSKLSKFKRNAALVLGCVVIACDELWTCCWTDAIWLGDFGAFDAICIDGSKAVIEGDIFVVLAKLSWGLPNAMEDECNEFACDSCKKNMKISMNRMHVMKFMWIIIYITLMNIVRWKNKIGTYIYCWMMMLWLGKLMTTLASDIIIIEKNWTWLRCWPFVMTCWCSWWHFMRLYKPWITTCIHSGWLRKTTMMTDNNWLMPWRLQINSVTIHYFNWTRRISPSKEFSAILPMISGLWMFHPQWISIWNFNKTNTKIN